MRISMEVAILDMIVIWSVIVQCFEGVFALGENKWLSDA